MKLSITTNQNETLIDYGDFKLFVIKPVKPIQKVITAEEIIEDVFKGMISR